MFRMLGFFPDPKMKEDVEAAAACAPGLNAAATEVVKQAAADAPHGSRSPGWAGSFRAVEAENVDGKMTAYAVSDHPVATIIEFGSVNNPPYRTLTRAAQSVGNFEDELGG